MHICIKKKKERKTKSIYDTGRNEVRKNLDVYH